MSLLSLVGMKWRPPADQVVPTLPTGTQVILVREPENTHDPNAIAVYLHLGYIAKGQASELGPAIDNAKETMAVETAKQQQKVEDGLSFLDGVRIASTGRIIGKLIQTLSGWPCVDIEPEDAKPDPNKIDRSKPIDDDIPF